MNPIAISDEDRDDLIEIVRDYIEDLFEDYDDGVITISELRDSTTKAASRAAAMVLPDAIENAAVPFIKQAADWLWEGLIEMGRRKPERLERRIQRNRDKGNNKRATKLQDILDDLLGWGPSPAPAG